VYSMPTSYNDPQRLITIEGDPVWSFDRDANALNVVGASTSAARLTIDTTGAIYFNQATGNDADPGTLSEPKQTFTAAATAAGAAGAVVQLDAGDLTVSGVHNVDIIAANGLAPKIIASDFYTMADRSDTAIVTTYNGAIQGGTALAKNIGVFYGSGNKFLIFNAGGGDQNWVAANDAGATGPFFAAVGFGPLILFLGTNEVRRFVSGGTAETPAVTTKPNFAWIHPPTQIVISCHNDGKLQSRPALTGAQTWTERALPLAWGAANVLCGTFGANTSVVVGVGAAAWSRDGVTWSMAGIPTTAAGKAIRGVTFGNSKFVAAGEGGIVISSSSGQNWQVETSIPAEVNSVDFDGQYFVFGCNGGLVYRSKDLATYDLIASGAGFGSTNVATLVVAGGQVIAAGGTSKVQQAPFGVITRQGICGYRSEQGIYVLNHDNKERQLIRLQNVTAPGIFVTADRSKNDVVANCVADSFYHVCLEIGGGVFKTIRETVIKGDLFENFNGATAANSGPQLDRCTIGGAVYSFSSQSSNNEIFDIRTTIINRGIFNYMRNTTATDSALRGYITPNITIVAPTYNLDPLFIEPPTDYRLATVAERPQNSPYLGKSTLFAPNGSAGTGRDLGAYSFDLAGLVESWTKAVVLPKPASSSFAIKPRAFYTPTRGGDPSGINRPNQWVEEISVAWTQLDAGQFAELMSLSIQESVRVRLTWDSILSTSSVTVSGNQSAGSPVLVIASQAVNPGSFLTIGGKKIYVYRVIAGSPTTLVLSSNLPASVTNGDVLPLTNVAGAGEYIMRWPDIERSRIQYARPLDDSNWRGVKVSFERRRALA